MSAVGAQGRRAAPAARAAAGSSLGFWPLLGAIAAVGALIRVLYTLLEAPWPPPAVDDQFFFSGWPRLIADGEGFINPFLFLLTGEVAPSAEHPPLYSVVLAAPAVVGIDSPTSQQLAGTVFGAATIVVVALVARRLAGDRAGLVAAGLAALYPVLVTQDGAIMSETLYVLLVGLTLLGALRLADAPSLRTGVAVGAVAGLAALTRGEALLLLPLVLLPALRRPGGTRAAAAALVALVVVLTPWTVRNWIAFDRPVLIATNSGTAIGGANCAETYAGDNIGGWWPDCLRPHPGNQAEVHAEQQRDGLDYAREHAGRLPVVAAARLGRLVSVVDPFSAPEGRSVRAHKLGTVAFWLLVPVALAGALVLRRRRVATWLVVAPVAVVVVTALLTYGNVRFRAPAELTLVVLAAVALDALWRRRAAGAPPA